MQLRRARTVEHRVQPIVGSETDRRVVFVLGQGDGTNARSALDLDEADLDERLGVLRMRAAGDQIEAAVLGFDAFDLPAPRPLVGDRGFHGDPFDLIVADHRRDLGIVALGVR